jgi:TM2 domain-containing membrane protein YozV
MTFCKQCGANLPSEGKFCYKCGQPLYAATTAIVQTDYVNLGPQQTAQHEYQPLEYHQHQSSTAPTPAATASQTQQVSSPAVVPDRKNPGVAAVLSFFWAGLGQIYNGEILKGICFMVLYAFSVLLCFVLIGFIILPVVWGMGMWDAYHTAKQYNERQLQNERERLHYDSLMRY